MNLFGRKKILFLITKSNWGGAQRYVYDLATHLDHTKFEPVVALGGAGVLSEMLKHAGVRVIQIESLTRDISFKKELDFSKELWTILRTEKPDILHVNSSKAGGLGTFLGRCARIPRVIFTAHGWAFNEDRPISQKLIIKFFHWLTVLFSHQTIAVSTAIVRQMNWPFIQNKMRIVYPGRNIGAMYTQSEARAHLAEVIPDLQLHLAKTWVITIAELHPIKRLGVLISAMAELKNTHPNLISIIIGEGQERRKLTEQIVNKHLESTVFLTGSITEAARFLKAGDVFVLPSKSESYGYVLHEAGLAGVPVLATKVGGIPDVIEDGVTGRLITPDDIPALVRELQNFVSVKGKWQSWAIKHQALMKERSVEKMVLQTTTLYELPL